MATSKEASKALGSNHSGKTRPVEALKSDYLDRRKPDPKEKDNLAEYHTRGMLQEEFENAMEMRETCSDVGLRNEGHPVKHR